MHDRECNSPADNWDEFGQFFIQLQPDTLGNCLSQLQQKLLAEKRDHDYRWLAKPLWEHYTLKLDVARRALEIMQTTSNGLSLRSQVKTSTMNVEIEECPDIDGMLQPA